VCFTCSCSVWWLAPTGRLSKALASIRPQRDFEDASTKTADGFSVHGQIGNILVNAGSAFKIQSAFQIYVFIFIFLNSSNDGQSCLNTVGTLMPSMDVHSCLPCSTLKPIKVGWNRVGCYIQKRKRKFRQSQLTVLYLNNTQSGSANAPG
jgi:hypothetical protein